ncbi:MAG TPA: YfjI family protein [Candidatus Hydrogenedentes bacterium]|nr:YfjI family protein [Candidatus Hydrogenedentota bacterium]HQM50366.1 YfjI family protein [Candidatus Hydrogenedentota bacterium]
MSRVPGWDGFEPIPREPGDDLLDELLEELTRQSQSIPPDWLGNDAWPQPIPLRPYEPPPWPAGAFPADIEEYVNSLSEATETPVELAACVVLAILATCVQGKYAVKIKDGYYEPLCLWTSCALPSGSRKSAVHSSAVTPLITWERSQRERIEPEIKRLESETETILARIKKLRGKAAEPANENPQNIQKQIEELEASLPLIPIVPRVWASDITPEHLGTLMAQQEGRMALLCDEAGILETIGGRYANGIPNLDLFLQGHSGTPVRVDRGSRPSVSIDKPALSVALMPQPVVIHALANKSEFRGRGLLARFLYTMPDHNLGFRTGDKPPVPDRVVQRYATIIVALLNRKGRASGNGTESPHILSLAPEAYDRWKDLSAELEKEMADGGKYEHLRDWAGKLPGAAGRIAAIFHVTRYAFENERNHLISLEEMEAATELARVFCKHALIAFDEMGADRTRDDARSILGWIRREKCASFSKRDVQRALQCTFKKSEEIDEPLAILADRHYIRQINEAKKPAGGRPSEKYEVNPDVFQVSEKP